MNLREIKNVLETRKLRPLRSLGQNFLHDAKLTEEIVDALPVNVSSRLIEVGPGLGAITGLLIDRGYKVCCLEIDKGICVFLKEKFGDSKNFTLVPGDALKTLPEVWPADAIIGNLPYNISTPLLVVILGLDPLPKRMVFTLQKEVALRLRADPGTPDYGVITVLTRTFFDIEVLRILGPKVFFPESAVNKSAVVRFSSRQIALKSGERMRFYRYVRRSFSQRRKKLRNTLGLDLDVRPDELTPEQWFELYQRHG